MAFRVREDFAIDVGFDVTNAHILSAAELTNQILSDLPATLYRSLDFKTVSGI